MSHSFEMLRLVERLVGSFYSHLGSVTIVNIPGPNAWVHVHWLWIRKRSIGLRERIVLESWLLESMRLVERIILEFWLWERMIKHWSGLMEDRLMISWRYGGMKWLPSWWESRGSRSLGLGMLEVCSFRYGADRVSILKYSRQNW